MTGGTLESDALVELFLVPQLGPSPLPASQPVIAPQFAGPAVPPHASAPPRSSAQTPEVVVRAAMKTTPEPVAEADSSAASQPAQHPGPSLRPVSLLALVPGVRPLGVESPYAPSIELGLDAAGLLHAAGWYGRGAPERTIADLLIASQWAREHAGLLGKLLGNLGPGPARPEVAMHLYTDDASRLRWLGAAGIQLHLAVRVAPASPLTPAGWTSARL